jgi:hypothetical protein
LLKEHVKQFMRQIAGKRLTYEQLIGKTEQQGLETVLAAGAREEK